MSKIKKYAESLADDEDFIFEEEFDEETTDCDDDALVLSIMGLNDMNQDI